MPAEAARQLESQGFVVLPGPEFQRGIAALQAAYDIAVASADPADLRVASSVRVTDFVNRSAEFDGLYLYPPLLDACRQVIGASFKLSNTCARTLPPGAPAQKLHVDAEYLAKDWPMLGYIWMIDGFDEQNGATAFVPGSHRWRGPPADMQSLPENLSLACGPAGSVIIFDASIWHGHMANRSSRARRSVQGHFVAREARSALDYRARMRPETLARINDLARHLLDCEGCFIPIAITR